MFNFRKFLSKQGGEFIGKNKATIFALVIFFIASNLLVAYFVSREHYLFSWDHVNYWQKFRYVCEHLSSPIELVRTLIYSIREDDYNYLPAFLLSPFGLLFGTSRMAYILAIVNIFAFAAVISFVFLHRRMCRMAGLTSAALPFVAASFMLLSPNFWHPILFGFLDVGGIFLINLILLIYLRRPFRDQELRDLIVIALLIPAMIFFRRWYAYWGASFYIAISVQTAIVFFCRRPFDVKNFFKTSLKIFTMVSVSAIFFFAVAPTFAGRILWTNYADIYSVYKANQTLIQSLAALIFNNFGVLAFLIFVAGAVYGAVDKRTRDFSVMLLIQGAVIFFLFTRTQDFDPHHYYLLLPAFLLFSSFLVARLLSSLKMGWNFVWVGIFLILLLNFLLAFSPADLSGPGQLRKIWRGVFTGVRHPPRVRHDIDEIYKIIDELNNLATDPGDRIYILASSGIFNCSIVESAYLSRNRYKGLSRKVLRTHDIDRRDGFPQSFLKAKYVVVASPIQYHVRPEDQRVMAVLAEMVLSRRNIGASFEKLPYEFTLDENVKVYLYRKIKSLNDSDLEALSRELRKDYPDRKSIFVIKKD